MQSRPLPIRWRHAWLLTRSSGCMKRVQPGDEKTMQCAEESAKASKQDDSVTESDIFGDDEDDD